MSQEQLVTGVIPNTNFLEDTCTARACRRQAKYPEHWEKNAEQRQKQGPAQRAMWYNHASRQSVFPGEKIKPKTKEKTETYPDPVRESQATRKYSATIDSHPAIVHRGCGQR